MSRNDPGDYTPSDAELEAIENPRWSVAIGGYPNGWEDGEKFATPEAAIARYHDLCQQIKGQRMTTVAIFDEHKGEGEPLDDYVVIERMAEEMGDPFYGDAYNGDGSL